MNGIVPFNNDDTSMADASLARIGGGCSRKRKRQEPIVESHAIIGLSAQHHLAEYGDQGKCNDKVLVGSERLLSGNEDVPGVRQQMAINAHIQHAQPATSAFVHNTTKTSEADCDHVCSGHVNAEQVCFGMVCIINSCCFSTLVIAEC